MRRLSFVVLAALACACSNSPTQTTNDSGSNPDASDAAVEAGPYLPTGYTQMAYLADTPTYKFTKAQQVIDGTHDYVAVLDTDAGRIVLHLLSQVAPIACNSFVFLVLNHYYDGIAFHRVIDQFMAQSGDPNTISGAPSTWGTGGPGYSFGLEVTPQYNFDDAGIVGMANTGQPNSNGSQFFITFVAYPSLNQLYTIWADVIEGLDVLPNIVRGQPPTTPTRITDAYIGMK